MKRKTKDLFTENQHTESTELNLATLPKDILVSIFTFFKNKELARITRVCKTFNEIINKKDVYVQKTMMMSNLGKIAKTMALASVPQLKEHTDNVEKAAERYLQELKEQPNWWPDLTADEAEYLLLANKADITSFIYRKSSQGVNFFCVSQVKTAKSEAKDSKSLGKPIKSTGALTLDLSGYSPAKKPRTVDPEGTFTDKELVQLRIDSKAQGREVVHYRFEIRPTKQYQLEESNYRIFTARYNENSKAESFSSFEQLKNYIGGEPFSNPESNAAYSQEMGCN